MRRACLRSAQEVCSELSELGFLRDCSALVTDHRALSGLCDVFLAVPGGRFDPRTLADDLIREQRCGLVLVEYDAQHVYHSVAVLPVLNLKGMLAELAARYYNTAACGLKVIAVTGTNGKTTVTRWIAQAFHALGTKAAVIGTLGYGLPDALNSHSGLTTPDVVGVHRVLHELSGQGCGVVCVEASSIGLDQGRLDGVPIDTAVLTNLSQDHLDYHESMEAYGRAKLLLAAHRGLQRGVVNADDPFSQRFQEVLHRQGVVCTSVGKARSTSVVIDSIVSAVQGVCVHLRYGHQVLEINAPVVGDFNVDNLALVFGVMVAHGFEARDVVAALSAVTAAPGRMERVADVPCVFVDYAHTPDALERVLCAVRPVAVQRCGRLIVVFGCGGDRDTTKRAVMGDIAARLADVVVITSDNPRSESPAQIVQDIRAGVGALVELHVELDRAAAIEWAVGCAANADVVVLAGKGHEQTQTIGAEVRAHSDAEVARRCVLERRVHV